MCFVIHHSCCICDIVSKWVIIQVKHGIILKKKRIFHPSLTHPSIQVDAVTRSPSISIYLIHLSFHPSIALPSFIEPFRKRRIQQYILRVYFTQSSSPRNRTQPMASLVLNCLDRHPQFYSLRPILDMKCPGLWIRLLPLAVGVLT